MKFMARLFAAAVAAAALLAPGEVLAARRHTSHASAPSFPMKADEYRKYADGRIEHVLGVIDKKLDRRGVSGDRKKAIHKLFDEVARDVRAEITKAAADGNVTEAEAKKIKALTAGLRVRLRERLRAEKNPKAKEKLAGEAAKREKAAKKDAAKDEKKKDADKDGEPDKAPKEQAKDKSAKAKPAKKKSGPTKPAKASTSKKQPPATVDQGADL